MKTIDKKVIAIGYAILAAALYGMSAPFSKLILKEISPYFLSSLLYLGAGFGMLMVEFFRKISKVERSEAKISKNELKYVILMIVLDILAPIFLLLGIKSSNASTASLLNNFEIVATSLIAFWIFKESINPRLWLAISLITISSIILSFNDIRSFSLSIGSILVLMACISWGFENNCTRKLSIKDPLQVVIIKGIGSGIGALIIAFSLKEISGDLISIFLSLLLGFFAFGLSIFFYVSAQRHLGASKTSAFYPVAPFVGVLLSFFLFAEPITYSFIIALLIMIVGTYFAINDKPGQNTLNK
jgi:drug/metabolite transporter (DMT)-like permease